MTNDSIDIRLQRRDTTPLPADAVLKFQAINRGKNPKYNYRWVLYADGRWFLAKHSGDTSDWQTPFDTDLPTTPTRQLPLAAVNDVIAQLEAANFLSQPTYQVDASVEDGSFYIITARLNGNEHEVIYEGIDNALAEFLNDFTYDNQ